MEDLKVANKYEKNYEYWYNKGGNPIEAKRAFINRGIFNEGVSAGITAYRKWEMEPCTEHKAAEFLRQQKTLICPVDVLVTDKGIFYQHRHDCPVCMAEGSVSF
jgi:hypothetical protein